MILNVNTEVEVKLTEKGKEILKNWNEKIYGFKISEDKFKRPLWELMLIFGPKMHMASKIPFINNEINVLIEED